MLVAHTILFISLQASPPPLPAKLFSSKISASLGLGSGRRGKPEPSPTDLQVKGRAYVVL